MRNVNAKIFLKTTAPITYIILLIFWIVTACNKDTPQTPDPIGSWTRMMEFDTGTWQVGLTLTSTGILRWEPIDSIPGHTASEVSYELNASGFRILNDSQCNTEAQYEFELTLDALILLPISDDCGPRQQALTGTWYRAK